MASSLGTMKSTEERERGKRHRSISKPSCFYKIMVSPTIQSKKLRIPEAFTRAFSDELSGAVTLTVPTGESWEVALVNEDNQLWFCNGWQEFVEYFSIDFAYFLLFLYDGTSKFKVQIFSPSACEILYPCNAHNSPQKGGPSTATNDLDIEVITLDSEDDEPPLHGHEEPMCSLLASDDLALDLHEGSMHRSENYANQGSPSSDECEGLMEEALASAGISMPENPFFVVLIKTYNIVKGQFMRIPSHFAQEHLKGKDGKIVKLEASNGKQWSVRCLKTRGDFNLSSGWIVFARENCLKVGDISVFELTDARNSVLKVHVGTKSQLANQDRWRKLLKNRA